MSPRWYNRAARRALDRRVVALVVVGLALIVGYQAWALRQTHRNAQTAEVAKTAVKKATTAARKATKLTKVQCATAASFYVLVVQLAEDTTAHFGSPPDGPIIPGAREETLARLHRQVAAATKTLRAQGCRIPTD